MEVANILAYYDTTTIIAVKSLIVQAPAYNTGVFMKTLLIQFTLGAQPNRNAPSGVLLEDAPALLTNIRLGWK
jgi:hypothetical protein